MIDVKQVGKKYTIGEKESYLALRDVLALPLRSIAHRPTKQEFWALRDLNFQVQQGEVLGVIGRNGAGKSTLLKILSNITPPTTGEIRMHGRVGSLLEVGTGFHPELTGRENIFLSGSILGMRKKEIEKKFDEIVDFAGIESFLDTPVKRFSSGMYVRLGFAIAAHLEPEILLVDEVLAVGDTEFQKKCLGKMEQITRGEGRTIIFVSHNLSAMKSLCQKALLLDHGKKIICDATDRVVDTYIQLIDALKNTEMASEKLFPARADVLFQFTRIAIVDRKEQMAQHISIGLDFFVEVEYQILSDTESIFLSLIFFDPYNVRVCDFMETDFLQSAIDKKKGMYRARIRIPAFFKNGLYQVMIVAEKGQVTLDKKDGVYVEIRDDAARIYPIQGRAPVMPRADWKTEALS